MLRSMRHFRLLMIIYGSLFGLAMLAVAFLAFNRQSGCTRLDPAKIQQMRHEAMLGNRAKVVDKL